MVKTWTRHKTTEDHRSIIEKWWAVGGGWWLVFGGWWSLGAVLRAVLNKKNRVLQHSPAQACDLTG